MERRAQPKKRYQSASYVTSGAVFYGTLLFLIARVFSLLQLFSDAYTRKQLDQAPPENFTFFGIMGHVLILAVIGLAFYLLLQNRQGRLRMKKGNFYLLLNALFVVWGIINAVSYLVEMILFFEFVYLLDFITLIVALVVPSVLYQISDRRQDIPQDNALFASAIAATGLSVIATLIVALVLRKSYTTLQLVRELMFRAGIILFGVAGLLKIVRLRAELPALVAELPKPAPKPVEKKPEPKAKKVDRRGRIACPDCGKKLAPDVKICPRCGYDIDTPDLFDDDEEFDDEYDEEYDEEPADDLPDEPEDAFEDALAEEPPEAQSAFAEPAREELPKEICPRCGRKKPPFLTKCPHCGYYPGDPIEQAEAEAERQRLAAEQATAVREEQPKDLCPRCGKNKPPFLATCPHCGYFPGDPIEQAEEKAAQQAAEQAAPSYQPPQPKQEPKCENCGRRIPGGLATCPYCGFHPDDARTPPPQKQEVPTLFEEEEEEDSIFCPRCDNEVAAGTEVCPHCGYPLSARRETGRIRRPTQRLPRVPDPKRLTEKNSIECPECGRRYSAARDRCPYCGFGLYDD
ncbi:MAG: zinc-ribbon domain-containing protein [Clostridiales bacterium]|nr:zinc-ribbon domain-containing protein [Clostridiales bacterium]